MSSAGDRMASRLKPEVPKCWLFTVCGMMWGGVGLLMCLTGMGWLAGEAPARMAAFGLAGIACALAAFHWIFGGIARKNIVRLRQLPEKGCFFAFQAWQSYLIVAFMIALGIILRRSPIPKSALSVIYIAIGGALLLASFFYYRHLMRLFRTSRRGRNLF